MSDRGSNSGFRTLVEDKDVAPGDSASQAGSSMSRASEKARRAAAEVQARTARRCAAKESEIAALREEIVGIETEGAQEALEVAGEVFTEELRKTGPPSRRAVSEPREVGSWIQDDQARRARKLNAKTSCVGRSGNIENSVVQSSSHRSIIPKRLFREEEGESQATGANGTGEALPGGSLELPRATEDTEETRRSRIEAWVSEAATAEADRKDSEESRVIYRDQDVRVKVPRQASSQAYATLQRRSVESEDLRPRKRPSETFEMSQREKGSQNLRRYRTSRIASPQRETVYSDWEEMSSVYRSARDSNLGLQDEVSPTEYAEFPPVSQQGRSERRSYHPRLMSENETPRRIRPSRQARETSWTHADSPQVLVTSPGPLRIIKREPLSRTSGSDGGRDEELVRRPSSRDTGAETSTRSSRQRPRSPQYENPRNEGPVREATQARVTAGNTVNGLEALIGVLQAPKVDLPTFKGDPMQYHMFMRAFDDNVERVISDPSSKLARLVQSCAGEAARVIQGCTLMLPERGYVRARQLLKDRFGDEFVIAELWGQRLMNTSNRMSLREFADELRAGYESLSALDALNELQTQSNLSEIVKKLPGYLQNRWRDVVRRLKVQEYRRPDMRDVVEYVEEAAAVASDPVYGNQKSEKNPASARVAYVTSNSLSCLVCEKEGHEVLNCEKFVTLKPEDRLQMAIRLRLCFVCLKGGHITRDCTSKMRCKAEDCGRMHATVLHAANWSRL